MPSTRSSAGSKRRFSTLTPIPENLFEPPFPSPTNVPHLPRGHSLDYELPSILATARKHYNLPLSTSPNPPPLKRSKCEIPYSPFLRAARPGDEIVIPPQSFRAYNGYGITLEERVYVDSEGVRWQAAEVREPWIFRTLVPDYQGLWQEQAMKALRDEAPVSPRTVRGRRREHEMREGCRSPVRASRGWAACSAPDLAQALGREVAVAWDVDEDLCHPFFPGMLAVYQGRSIAVA